MEIHALKEFFQTANNNDQKQLKSKKPKKTPEKKQKRWQFK